MSNIGDLLTFLGEKRIEIATDSNERRRVCLWKVSTEVHGPDIRTAIVASERRLSGESSCDAVSFAITSRQIPNRRRTP
jgi:hypothetical protein